MSVIRQDQWRPRGFGLAVLAALVAFAASYASLPFSRNSAWVYFLSAVMVSAWWGGQRASLVTTTLLVVLGRYFFMKPAGSFSMNQGNLFQILLFSGTSLFIGFLASARRSAEAHQKAELGRFQATVSSIADAVIATDASGRVNFMNRVALELTGWNFSEARNRHLDEVFVVLDEQTGAPATSPFERVLATGVAQRLPSRSILVGRDGRRRPIDDSAAPIKNDPGTITGVVMVFRDVTGRKEEERATRRRAEQLQKLAEIATRINAAHDVKSIVGVVTEEARNLVKSHKAATSIVLTLQHPEVINVISEPADDPDGRNSPEIGALDLYEAVKAEDKPVRLSQKELESDPRWRTLEKVALVVPSKSGWLAAPFIGRSGRSVGLIQLADKKEGEFNADDEAILVQLSKLAAIAIENARLYDELRANDQRKDEFLAMLAHELRNPLAAIGNAVSVTTRSGTLEHVEWAMDIITRQMKHLTRLIDDLLDVSRISRGKIELRKDLIDATPIIDSAVATVRPLIEERRHTIEMAVDRGNLWTNVDPTRLEQILVNLLNNAAKYSENGGHITLSAGTEGDHVVFTIKDRGVGIPPEKLPLMFELFAQGDRSLARSEGGLGIGLTVVKKLVEMHGGSVTAKSEGGETGSEFSFRIPSAEKPTAPSATDPSKPLNVPRKTRILVVDDNLDTSRGMVRLLRLLGHEVKAAEDGYEALEVARGFVPEFMLLDIGLPGIDGYEVASRLRKEECGKEAVIVAVSGYGQEDDLRRSKEAGFDFHLIKPLDHDVLLSLLSTPAADRL